MADIKLPKVTPYRSPNAPNERLEHIPIGYIDFKDAVEFVGRMIFGAEWTGAERNARSDYERHDQDIMPAVQALLLSKLSPEEREDHERAIQYAEKYPDDPPIIHGDPPWRPPTADEMSEICKPFEESHRSESDARRRLTTAIHDLLDKFRANPLMPRAAMVRRRFSTIPNGIWDTVIETSIYPHGRISFSGRDGSAEGWVYVLKTGLDELYGKPQQTPKPKKRKARKGRGKKPGDGSFDKLDEPFLKKMKTLIKNGNAASAHAAAGQIVTLHEAEIAGNDFKQKQDRLGRKNRENVRDEIN